MASFTDAYFFGRMDNLRYYPRGKFVYLRRTTVNLKVKNDIKHTGLIFDIVGNRIDVAVTPESACASCQAASMCVMSETEDKVVSVLSDHPDIYNIGEQVEVSVGKSMGVKAVVLAYVVPFIVLLVVLIAMLAADAGEVVSGLSALGAVGVYYGGLYIFRKHLESEIIFNINKIR